LQCFKTHAVKNSVVSYTFWSLCTRGLH